MINNNIQTTLKYCLESTRRGENRINVFDLMYETGLTYPELQSALNDLAERKLIIQPDKKTVEYIGVDEGEEFRLSEIDTMLEDINITDENFESVLRSCYDGLDEIKQMIEFKRKQGDVDEAELKKCEDLLNGHYARLFELRKKYIKFQDAPAKPCSTRIDESYIEILGYCVKRNEVSASFIQRHFPVGYVKACRIIDWMEEMGYITPMDGCKPRKFLINADDFDRIYGEGTDNIAFETGQLFKEDHYDDDDDEDDFDIDMLFKNDDDAYAEEDNEEKVTSDPVEEVASMFASRLNETFKWGRNPRGVVIYSEGFKFSTGDDVQFRLICKDEGVYLSDDGFIRNTLASKSHCGYTRAQNKILKYIKGKRVEYFLGELHMEVGIYTFFTDYMYLYSLIEGLLAD